MQRADPLRAMGGGGKQHMKRVECAQRGHKQDEGRQMEVLSEEDQVLMRVAAGWMKTYDTISGRFLLDLRDCWEPLWSTKCSLPDSPSEDSPSGLCICSNSCMCSVVGRGEYLWTAAIPEIGIVDSEITEWPLKTASGTSYRPCDQDINGIRETNCGCRRKMCHLQQCRHVVG